MTAGVPGTGIGGLFYLLAALFLPLRGIVRLLRKTRTSWREVMSMVGLATGVFLGIWLTGWLLGLIIGPAAQSIEVKAGIKATLVRTENIVRGAALVAGFATLAAVLLAVQAARWLTRKKSP